MFEQVYRYFKTIGNSDHISAWKAKGWSAERMKEVKDTHA